MEPTFILFLVGWGALGLLLISFLVGNFLDFLDFDAFDGNFSGTAVVGFIAIFGLTGGLLRQSTELPLVACLAIAVVAGFIAGLFLAKLLKYFSDSDSGEVAESSLAGARGMVTLEVPAEGFGKVKVNNSGHTLELAATSTTGKIDRGTPVIIKDIMGVGTVIVERETPQEETNILDTEKTI